MGRTCIVGCSDYNQKHFRFPNAVTDNERREIWLTIFKDFITPVVLRKKHLFVCVRHFSDKMFANNCIRKNAIPDINLEFIPAHNEDDIGKNYADLSKNSMQNLLLQIEVLADALQKKTAECEQLKKELIKIKKELGNKTQIDQVFLFNENLLKQELKQELADEHSKRMTDNLYLKPNGSKGILLENLKTELAFEKGATKKLTIENRKLIKSERAKMENYLASDILKNKFIASLKVELYNEKEKYKKLKLKYEKFKDDKVEKSQKIIVDQSDKSLQDRLLHTLKLELLNEKEISKKLIGDYEKVKKELLMDKGKNGTKIKMTEINEEEENKQDAENSSLLYIKSPKCPEKINTITEIDSQIKLETFNTKKRLKSDDCNNRLCDKLLLEENMQFCYPQKIAFVAKRQKINNVAAVNNVKKIPVVKCSAMPMKIVKIENMNLLQQKMKLPVQNMIIDKHTFSNSVVKKQLEDKDNNRLISANEMENTTSSAALKVNGHKWGIIKLNENEIQKFKTHVSMTQTNQNIIKTKQENIHKFDYVNEADTDKTKQENIHKFDYVNEADTDKTKQENIHKFDYVNEADTDITIKIENQLSNTDPLMENIKIKNEIEDFDTTDPLENADYNELRLDIKIEAEEAEDI